MDISQLISYLVEDCQCLFLINVELPLPRNLLPGVKSGVQPGLQHVVDFVLREDH